MIETIEIAPNIYAKELADHIFMTYGTVERYNGMYYDYVLNCNSIEDLAETIKKFMNAN